MREVKRLGGIYGYISVVVWLRIKSGSVNCLKGFYSFVVKVLRTASPSLIFCSVPTITLNYYLIASYW